MDSLAERLEYLFEHVHPPERGPYTVGEIAAKLRERGTPISRVTLWSWRTGKTASPGVEKLRWMAEVFGVPVAYFTDGDVAEQVKEQIAFVVQLQDAGVQRVASRVVGLSEDGLTEVLAAIQRVRHREGFDREPSDDGDEAP